MLTLIKIIGGHKSIKRASFTYDQGACSACNLHRRQSRFPQIVTMDNTSDPSAPNGLVRESVILPSEQHETYTTYEQYKAAQRRKVSVPSIRDDDKAKHKIGSKSRWSLPHPSEEMPDILVFGKPTVSIMDHPHSSATNKLLTVNEDHDNEGNESDVSKSPQGNSPTQRSPRVRKTSRKPSRRNPRVAVDENDTPQSVEVTGTDENRSESPSKALPKVLTLEEKLSDTSEIDTIGNLNLSAMKLTDGDVRKIIQRGPWEHKKCIGIILRDNDLTAFGVHLLIDGLIAAKAKLQYLSLSNNPRMGDAGIEHLVRFLKTNRAMTLLSIPNTGITDRGVRMLADALCGADPGAPSVGLEKLHISFNKLITDESVDSLLEILSKNQTLKNLCVQNCNLTDSGRDRLRKASIKKKKKRFSLSD